MNMHQVELKTFMHHKWKPKSVSKGTGELSMATTVSISHGNNCYVISTKIHAVIKWQTLVQDTCHLKPWPLMGFILIMINCCSIYNSIQSTCYAPVSGQLIVFKPDCTLISIHCSVSAPLKWVFCVTIVKWKSLNWMFSCLLWFEKVAKMSWMAALRIKWHANGSKILFWWSHFADCIDRMDASLINLRQLIQPLNLSYSCAYWQVTPVRIASLSQLTHPSKVIMFYGWINHIKQLLPLCHRRENPWNSSPPDLWS